MAAVLLLPGCVGIEPSVPPGVLARRIVPEGLEPLPSEIPDEAPTGADDDGPAESSRSTGGDAEKPAARSGLAAEPRPGSPSDAGNAPELTLEAARSLALRLNPQLEQARAAVDTAAGGEEIAYAGFLPTLTGNYGYQAYSSAVGFTGTRGRFPVLPVRGFGPGTQDFHVTEMQIRWTIFQFGKQVARHDQAILREEIAKLQLDRSRQTIEFDVSEAYYRVLQARSSLISAEQAVVRAEAVLRDAQDLERRGVITREDVLRTEVQVAEVRQLRTSARSAEQVAVAGLNRAIGMDVNAPTRVAERRSEPEVKLSLGDCLRLAVENRREFTVVQRGVAVAAADVAVAKADFLPALSIQSTVSNVTGTGVQNSNVLGGGIFATLDLYTGGRRRGQLTTACAGVRRAVAQAQQVCDGIAYEVHSAYRGVEDAHERIVQSRTAVAQARENLRLIRNRYETGDVTLTDLIDAETTTTRAEQNFSAAFYDYQTALARLEYATGAPVAEPGEVAAGAEESLPPAPTTPSPFVAPPTPRPREERGPAPFRLPSLLPLPPSPPGGAAPPGPSVVTPPALPTPGIGEPNAPSLARPPGLARPPYEQQAPLGPNPPSGPPGAPP